MWCTIVFGFLTELWSRPHRDPETGRFDMTRWTGDAALVRPGEPYTKLSTEEVCQRALQQSKKEAELRALTMAKARDCVEGEFTLQSVPLHHAGPRTRVRVSLLPLTNGKQICAISFEQDAQVGPRGTRPAVTRVGEGRWSRLVSRDGADGRNVARVRVHGRWTRDSKRLERACQCRAVSDVRRPPGVQCISGQNTHMRVADAKRIQNHVTRTS